MSDDSSPIAIADAAEIDLERASSSDQEPAIVPNDAAPDPLGDLPKVCMRRTAAETALRRLGQQGPLLDALAWISTDLRNSVKVSHPEILWRSSGNLRPGVIVHLSWPRLASRIGFAVETPIVHKIVDQLLGYQRLPGEDRLQISPVEYGVWTYILTQTLARLQDRAGPFGEWDLAIDRIGPQAFEPNPSTPMLTICWPVRVGSTQGAVRLWVPESLAMQWALGTSDSRPASPPALSAMLTKYQHCSSLWRAEAGRIEWNQGIAALKPGDRLPIVGHPIQGTPAHPRASVILRADTLESVCEIPADLAEQGRGAVVATAPLSLIKRPAQEFFPGQTKEIVAMSTSASQTSPAVNISADLPVTLIVELGRVSLPLAKLADLKPGDVLDLKRNSREPVELTSNGRLIARGELVQVEENIGVRITYVLT